MKRKHRLLDILAGLALVFNVDWEEEYELMDVEDIFWEKSVLEKPIEVTNIIQDTKIRVS